jgi:hypothetical protein
LVRQVLGAVAEFEKTILVAKLAAARRLKRIATGEKVEGPRRGEAGDYFKSERAIGRDPALKKRHLTQSHIVQRVGVRCAEGRSFAR